jgi:outer membrane protein TolC
MSINKSRATMLLTCFLYLSSAKSQGQYLDGKLSVALQTDKLLPILIEMATKTHPDFKIAESNKLMAVENLKIVRKNIFNALSLSSSYYLGNTPTFGSGQITPIKYNSATFYNVGVAMQLPITHIINRKNNIKNAELQAVKNESEKAGTSLIIKQEIIRLYQEMKLAHRLVLTTIEGKQGSSINYKLAEKQFVQGDIPLSELSRLQEILTRSSIEFETANNRLQTAYMQLDAYTDNQLTKLLSNL